MSATTVSKKTFFLLWALCILGGWSVLPYVQHLGILPSTVSIWRVALLGTVQAVLFFGLICWISFKTLPKTDLHPFPTLHRGLVLKQTVYPALISGGLVGLAIFVSDWHRLQLLKSSEYFFSTALLGLYLVGFIGPEGFGQP